MPANENKLLSEDALRRKAKSEARRGLYEKTAIKALIEERRDDRMEGFGHLGPTPETRNKLRADVVVRLKKQGKLDGPEALAAEEIRDVWRSIERVMFPRRNLEEAYGRASGGWNVKSAIEKLRPSEYRKWQRYRIWAGECLPGELAIVLDVVKDNYGPWQVGVRLGLAKGGRKQGGATILGIVRDALRRYAMRAGFRVMASARF